MEIEERDYLTIGEFGSLRNVDSKALRYYERVGALIPAYIDPHTQYRYYTVSQLVDLDTILLCLEMGIPLKGTSKYRGKDGVLAVKKLFEDGKRITQDKIEKYKTTLMRLQYALDCISNNDRYKDRHDYYVRRINRRYILKKPLEDPKDFASFSKQSLALFTQAKERGFDSGYTFPIGILLERGLQSSINASIFLEVLNPPTDDERIFVLKEKEYYCYQESQTALFYSHNVYESILAEQEDADLVVITNMTLDTYRHDIFPIEVQIST
ncbi:MerR family transcriptional regulator [Corynebacterium poyangense]|uniref:MerR family transcriptional regulator n=1 Tax=Corynebacterium poyangense TaxID=2684405 RepID=A0A7H0SPP3_9CORY|nr:MerR family transcriptional regulator [Corynebacterium poyangense]QNQ90518.1 MerR family transcriptional regulator [Corynebacterium poyangense]